MTALDFLARWRVRLGYLLTIVVLLFARPTPRSIAIGAVLGIIGLCIRAYAAGYLHKQEILTITGPYARTRNPLYFGSSFLALGAALATNSVLAAAPLLIYFAVVYAFVMRREELELQPAAWRCFCRLRRPPSLCFSPGCALRTTPPLAANDFPGCNTRRTTSTKQPWVLLYC